VLSELIQAKLGEGEGIPLDVSAEVRKLKILRVWCAVSLKLIGESRGQQKYTINAIQAYKGSLEKLNYPQNSLKRQIDAWDNEYAVLNRRVNRFLEKGKVGEMELHEEMRAMSLKMSLQEAEELRDELQRSALNF
jgi:predicted RNase H-like nuclease (RuvC/YqgF family)